MSDTFTLGQHDAAIKTLLEGQKSMSIDIGTIKDILAEQRGERRFIAVVWGAVSGGVMSFLGFLLTKGWLATHK